MMFIPKDPIFIGIESTSDSFKIAVLRKKGKSWVFPKLVEVPKAQLLDHLPKMGTLVVSLPSREILIKNLNIPLKGNKKIDAAFDFQVEPILPFPLDKCIVQYLKIQEKDQGSALTVFAVKKEPLGKEIEYYKHNYDLEPDVVSSPALALAALASIQTETIEPFFFVHIGKDEGTCALIEKGKILIARSFEKDKKEIEKTFLALTSLYKNKKIDSCLLISEEPEWVEILQTVTQKGVLYPSFPTLPLSEENLHKFGLTIGLCLAAAEKFPNFRQKEFRLPFSWKKMRLPILTLATLTFTLFSSLFFLEKSYLAKKEAALFERYSSVSQEKVSNLVDLEDKIGSLKKRIEETPNLFPLLPLLPKPNDFLAWISRIDIPVKIEDFRYQMVKRPDAHNLLENYLVQITLVVSAENGSALEGFRTFLSAPNPFVDSKNEIEWENEQGKYKAVFYLKDKTRYN